VALSCTVALQCSSCLKTFVRPCLLRSHVRLAHPMDNSVEVYSCTESGCNRTYASVRSMKQHIALFHKTPVLKCPHCLRSLTTKVAAFSTPFSRISHSLLGLELCDTIPVYDQIHYFDQMWQQIQNHCNTFRL